MTNEFTKDFVNIYVGSYFGPQTQKRTTHFLIIYLEFYDYFMKFGYSIKSYSIEIHFTYGIIKNWIENVSSVVLNGKAAETKLNYFYLNTVHKYNWKLVVNIKEEITKFL